MVNFSMIEVVNFSVDKHTYDLTAREDEGEYTIRTANGRDLVWDFSSSPLGSLPDGRRVVVSTAIDVTDRALERERRGYATRALTTYLACSQLLVHATDEQAFLQGICDAAVNEGSYLMAWAGYVVQQAASAVEPRAFAGREDGFLAETAAYRGGEGECGPACVAVRERRPVLVRGAESDTRFLASREARLKRGYRAMAALPLIDANGTAFGVIEFIAAELDAFDVDEVKLLEELADAAAYGVQILREAATRSKGRDQLVRENGHLKDQLFKLTELIARANEARDPYSEGHELRSSAIAVAIARKMKLPARMEESVRVAALVHDVGNLEVPAEIVSKAGKLSDAETALVRRHPLVGYDILREVPFEWPVAEIVLQHHERMDGSGYPYGISGDQLLLEARIVAVAEAVEAMSSQRPYRPAMSPDRAVAEIVGAEGQYDPVVAQACQSLLEDWPQTLEGLGLGH